MGHYSYDALKLICQAGHTQNQYIWFMNCILYGCHLKVFYVKIQIGRFQLGQKFSYQEKQSISPDNFRFIHHIYWYSSFS